MFGKLIALPIRIANIPFKAFDSAMSSDGEDFTASFLQELGDKVKDSIDDD